MSWLAEVLAMKENALVVHIKEKIPVITSQIDKLKYEVKKYMEKEHVDLSYVRNVNNELLQQAINLNSEMVELNEQIAEVTIKNIDQSTLELDILSTELEEGVYALQVATQLVNINEALKRQKQYVTDKKHLEAAEEISLARKIINDIPSNEQINLINAIKNSLALKRQSLLDIVSNVWQENVIIEMQEKDDEVNTIIKINNNSNYLEQSLKTFYHEKDTSQLDILAKWLLKDILNPIINNTVKIKTYENDNFTIMNVEIKAGSGKMEYNTVIENITIVFDYLCATINHQVFTNLLVLGYIGEIIRDEFCENFIKNCLADTVPSTQEGLTKYKEVVVEIEMLQTLLVDCQFFSANSRSILEYAGNVNELFANKICQMYIERARNILKKDLHDTVQVGVDLNNSQNLQKYDDFSKCCVSRSACEYLNLARLILDQATNSLDVCAGQLLYTAKQIFELYCKLIPEFHKKLLDTIPQQVALFHNNCMYLSHELITFDEFYIDKISKNVVTGESFDYQITYLKVTGTDIFLKYMRSQEKQIEEILNDSELALLGQTEKLDPNCEKSIRQCLRQLELLKTVWQKVLSYEVYNKTIGELLNSFIDNLIKLVLIVEDISTDTSTLLVDMFKIVQNRGPKLFTDSKEINLFVKHWYKFNELILLLSSSLSDINDRWADGKGPLAVEYLPEDVKRLIRALFQNTDRRSALLSRIN